MVGLLRRHRKRARPQTQRQYRLATRHSPPLNQRAWGSAGASTLEDPGQAPPVLTAGCLSAAPCRIDRLLTGSRDGRLCRVTPQQLNMLAVVSPAVCWGAFVLTWIAGAIYNDSRAPAAERTRTWFPRTGWVIVAVARGGRWIAPFPVFLVILEIKIRVEERLMLAEFPDAYPRYRQRVPKLVPGLRLFSSRSVVSG